MSTAERAAALARKTKGTTAAATTAITNGSYHHTAAAPFPIGHGHGAAAATTPSVGFGTVAATSSQAGFGVAACSQAGFGAAAAASTLSGFGTAAVDSPPIYGRSFTGDSNHARGGSSGASPVWWDAADSGSPISPAFRRPASWDRDNNSHPPGGFMDILNNQANFHLVGAPSLYTPFKAPRSADVGGSFASMDASLPSDVEILSYKQPAIVDRDRENVRTKKRIMWTPKEDEILMGAWIENSTDSTTRADRKGEAYWGDVIKAYNKNTPSQRRRSAKQAKDRWHKINRWCHLFECAYLKARRVYTSGYSDQMWMDAADEFYLEDNKDEKLGPFVLKNVWKICRKVPKWISYNEELKNARKRKSYHLEEDGENLQTEDDMPKQPIGQKAAKKAALAAKDKSKAMHDDEKSKESAVEKLDKLSKVQEEANAKRMKVLELQQKLSSDKIETTKLAHLTAQENRESKKLEIEGRKLEMESNKLEKESKMMDTYNSLISQDTSSMTVDEKAD